MLKKYLKIYIHFFKMNVLKRMAYRWNFFFFMIIIPLHLGIYILFVKIIYNHLNLIAGWDLYHSLLIVGSMIFIEGGSWVLCSFMSDLRRRVREGTLDGLIIKPISTQFLVSVNRINPEDLSRFFVALIIMIYAFKNIGGFTFSDVLIYIFLIINAFIIFYSIITILSTISFWVVENRALFFVSRNILLISQYPTDIYTGIMKTIFSFVIPIAFIATVPAKVLSGWYNWTFVAQSFLLAAIFFYISRKFFLYGLKHYSSASS